MSPIASTMALNSSTSRRSSAITALPLPISAGGSSNANNNNNNSSIAHLLSTISTANKTETQAATAASPQPSASAAAALLACQSLLQQWSLILREIANHNNNSKDATTTTTSSTQQSELTFDSLCATPAGMASLYSFLIRKRYASLQLEALSSTSVLYSAPVTPLTTHRSVFASALNHNSSSNSGGGGQQSLQPHNLSASLSSSSASTMMPPTMQQTQRLESTQYVNSLCDALFTVLHQLRVTHESIALFTSVESNDSNNDTLSANPACRHARYKHALDWYTTQLQCDTRALPHWHSSMQQLMLAGLTDTWSAVRRSCQSRMTRLVPLLTASMQHTLLDAILALFDAKSQQQQQQSWQSCEGATVALALWFDARHKSMTHNSNTVAMDHDCDATNRVLPLLYRLVSHEQLSVREAVTRCFASLLRAPKHTPEHHLLHISSSSSSNASKRDDSTSSQVNTQVASAILHRLMNRLQCKFDPTAAAAPTAKTTTTATQTEFESNVVTTAAVEPLSPSFSNQSRLLSDYEAQGILSICDLLLTRCCTIENLLSSSFTLYYSCLELYLAHHASSVRQQCSALLAHIAMRHTELRHRVTLGIVREWQRNTPLAVTQQQQSQKQPQQLCVSDEFDEFESPVCFSVPPALQVNSTQANTRRQDVNAQSQSAAAIVADLRCTWQWKEGALMLFELVLTQIDTALQQQQLPQQATTAEADDNATSSLQTLLLGCVQLSSRCCTSGKWELRRMSEQVCLLAVRLLAQVDFDAFFALLTPHVNHDDSLSSTWQTHIGPLIMLKHCLAFVAGHETLHISHSARDLSDKSELANLASPTVGALQVPSAAAASSSMLLHPPHSMGGTTSSGSTTKTHQVQILEQLQRQRQRRASSVLLLTIKQRMNQQLHSVFVMRECLSPMWRAASDAVAAARNDASTDHSLSSSSLQCGAFASVQQFESLLAVVTVQLLSIRPMHEAYGRDTSAVGQHLLHRALQHMLSVHTVIQNGGGVTVASSAIVTGTQRSAALRLMHWYVNQLHTVWPQAMQCLTSCDCDATTEDQQIRVELQASRLLCAQLQYARDASTRMHLLQALQCVLQPRQLNHSASSTDASMLHDSAAAADHASFAVLSLAELQRRAVTDAIQQLLILLRNKATALPEAQIILSILTALCCCSPVTRLDLTHVLTSVAQATQQRKSNMSQLTLEFTTSLAISNDATPVADAYSDWDESDGDDDESSSVAAASSTTPVHGMNALQLTLTQPTTFAHYAQAFCDAVLKEKGQAYDEAVGNLSPELQTVLRQLSETKRESR